LGKLAYGTPYFYPINFVSSIIKFRKLKLRDKQAYDTHIVNNPWQKESYRFTNLPLARRAKDKIFKLFDTYFWVQIGWPISISYYGLGWKDKWETPRFEWPPSFQIYFFKWQFCIFWNAPNGDNDNYYEQILWYMHYSNKNISEAKNTWKWVNYNTKKSTWDDSYLTEKQK